MTEEGRQTTISKAAFDREPFDTTEISAGRVITEQHLRSGAVAVMTVIGGPDEGRVIHPLRDGMTFGRSASCDVCLRGSGLSRRHFALQCDDLAQYSAVDTGSTNGLYLDGRRISRVRLADGDTLMIAPKLGLHFGYETESNVELRERQFTAAVRDHLTGVFNRRYFEHCLDQEIECTARRGTCSALVLLDIDHFKKINDCHGHPTGDAVLAEVARRLNEPLVGLECLARVGGEEFALLLPGYTVDRATTLADELRRDLERTPVSHAGKSVPTTMSGGVARIDGVAAAEEALTRADEGLYEAKRAGRNRIVAPG